MGYGHTWRRAPSAEVLDSMVFLQSIAYTEREDASTIATLDRTWRIAIDNSPVPLCHTISRPFY